LTHTVSNETRENEKTKEMFDQVNDFEPKKWREYEKEGLQFFSVWEG